MSRIKHGLIAQKPIRQCLVFDRGVLIYSIKLAAWLVVVLVSASIPFFRLGKLPILDWLVAVLAGIYPGAL